MGRDGGMYSGENGWLLLKRKKSLLMLEKHEERSQKPLLSMLSLIINLKNYLLTPFSLPKTVALKKEAHPSNFITSTTLKSSKSSLNITFYGYKKSFCPKDIKIRYRMTFCLLYDISKKKIRIETQPGSLKINFNDGTEAINNRVINTTYLPAARVSKKG